MCCVSQFAPYYFHNLAGILKFDMIRSFIVLFLVGFSLFTSPLLHAQKTLANDSWEENYQKGYELFLKQKYGVAREYFEKALDDYGNKPHENKANAAYYLARSAMELRNRDAEYLLFNFLAKYPTSTKQNQAKYQMGLYYYNNKKYDDALEWFEKVKAYDLGQEKDEYFFKYGYSAFEEEEFESAGKSFVEVKDTHTKYAAPALYYYSHIAYENREYAKALEGFLRLTDDETFAPLTPYYISQIYYLQGQYQKVIEYAPELIDDVNESRKNELYRIIGDSYFRLNNFENSKEYLEIFMQNTRYPAPADHYLMGYTYYQLGEYQQAIPHLEKASNGNDRLAQNALYHLGDCYLKAGDKNRARIAFSSASNLDYDEEIKENALYNYALLTFELAYDPFNEGIKALNEYLERYPNSERVDEVYNYMVIGYMNTKNYNAALKSIEKIKNPNNQIKEAHQRIAYYRGVELFKNENYNQAIERFNKAIELGNYNSRINVLALFWKAESYYKTDDFQRAGNTYLSFMNSPGANSLSEYNKVQYNLGYTHFKQKNYSEAASWFEKFINSASVNSATLKADAYNRLGDMFFAQKSYWPAIEEYEQAYNIGVSNPDYALYQKGFSFGLVDRMEKKVQTMQLLLSAYPASTFADDALFETGRAYVAMFNNQNAIGSFEKLLNRYPQSNLKRAALVQLGLIHYNEENNQAALKYYKQAVEEFPGTPEARDALTGIKNIYVDDNNVDTYFAYVQQQNISTDMSISTQDSLTFASAENVYMTGNCDKAVESLNSYLQRFPDGSLALNAHFYLADCLTRNGRDDEAIESLRYIVNQPQNVFTRQAHEALALISFRSKNYSQALESYLALENLSETANKRIDAQAGAMRSYYHMREYTAAIEKAHEIKNQNIPAALKREATYITASAYLAMDRDVLALEAFSEIAGDVSTVQGAEAKYRVAILNYNRGEKEKAKEVIFNFIDQNTPHQYWMARSFILLSDIYVDENDNFQAVHTLQSIIDYYEDSTDGILETAKDKKQVILHRDEELRKEFEPDDVEIDISN